MIKKIIIQILINIIACSILYIGYLVKISQYQVIDSFKIQCIIGGIIFLLLLNIEYIHRKFIKKGDS